MQNSHSVKKRIITIFDLDKTLTTKDTFVPYLIGLMLRNPMSIFAAPYLLYSAVQFYLKKITNSELKQRYLLKITPAKKLNRHKDWGITFSQIVHDKFINAVAKGKIREALERGEVVLATASIDSYVTPLAKLLGIEHVICTKLEIGDQGIPTGRLDSKNCYGKEKLQRVKEFLGRWEQEVETHVYTDHHSDLPLLMHADHPIAVNPNKELLAESEQQAFEIEYWY